MFGQRFGGRWGVSSPLHLKSEQHSWGACHISPSPPSWDNDNLVFSRIPSAGTVAKDKEENAKVPRCQDPGSLPELAPVGGLLLGCGLELGSQRGQRGGRATPLHALRCHPLLLSQPAAPEPVCPALFISPTVPACPQRGLAG